MEASQNQLLEGRQWHQVPEIYLQAAAAWGRLFTAASTADSIQATGAAGTCLWHIAVAATTAAAGAAAYEAQTLQGVRQLLQHGPMEGH
jgi:hypothetical protein